LKSIGWIALYLFLTGWYAVHTLHAVEDITKNCKAVRYQEVKIKEKEEIMVRKNIVEYTAVTLQGQAPKSQSYFYIYKSPSGLLLLSRFWFI